MDNAVQDFFWLSVLLLILAYFVGFTQDVKTVSSAVQGLINTGTGRNAQGQFAGYPSGASSNTTAFVAL